MATEPILKTIALNKKNVRNDRSIIEIVKSRQTPELVLAFCGPLGSGVTTVAKKVMHLLKEYGYQTSYLKVSDLITKHFELVKEETSKETDIDSDKAIESLPHEKRIEILQTAGNKLREKYEHDILSQLIISEIAILRHKPEPDDLENKTRRFATVIDSLKHPAEVELLKAVYGNMFYLFGCLCPEHLRAQRLSIGEKK